jgi:hypothetical protein
MVKLPFKTKKQPVTTINKILAKKPVNTIVATSIYSPVNENVINDFGPKVTTQLTEDLYTEKLEVIPVNQIDSVSKNDEWDRGFNASKNQHTEDFSNNGKQIVPDQSIGKKALVGAGIIAAFMFLNRS